MSNKWSKNLTKWSPSTIAKWEEDPIVKARLKMEEAAHKPKTFLEDPLRTSNAGLYKERTYALDYNIMKTIPQQLSVIGAIIQTRCNQVGSFSVPFRNSKSVGYQISHKNPGKLTTKGEREFILRLEEYIANCGYNEANRYADPNYVRDDFETFLKKLVRDSLTIDAGCFEIVPSRDGTPYEFLSVDSSTIRLAISKQEYKDRVRNNQLFGTDFEQSQILNSIDNPPRYVQLIDGEITAAYTPEELAYGIRNPRTDVNVYGYGYSELEMLIKTITSHLNAETYNSVFFTNACVGGETIVQTRAGLLLIEDLVAQPIETWNGFEYVPATVVRSGKKPGLKITLSNGFSMVSSKDHRFLVLNPETNIPEMVPLEDLDFTSKVAQTTPIDEFLDAMVGVPIDDEFYKFEDEDSNVEYLMYNWVTIKSIEPVGVVPMYDVVQTHHRHQWSTGGCILSNSTPKGILNFKGDSMSPDQLEGFRRMWKETLEGVRSSWKTPILQSESGIDWIDLHPSNREMEYGQWIEYLLKVSCFLPGTHVTMADGRAVPIEEINPGDQVLSHTRVPRTVKNIQVSLLPGNAYKLVANGSPIYTTKDHPFFVVKKGTNKTEAKLCRAEEIQPGDYLVSPKPKARNENAEEQYLDILEGDETGSYKVAEDGKHFISNGNRYKRYVPIDRDFAFLTGAFVGKGWHGKRELRISSIKSPLMEEITEDISKICVRRGFNSRKDDFKRKIPASTPEHGIWFSSSKVLNEFFPSVCGSKSFQKRIPDFIWESSGEVQKVFITSLLTTLKLASVDGFGLVAMNRSRGVLDDLQQLLATLGVYSTVNLFKKDRVTKRWEPTLSTPQQVKIYGLGVSPDQLAKLLKLVEPKYRPFLSHRSVEELESLPVSVLETAESYLVPIQVSGEIDTSDNTKVYNLEVEEENTYIVNGIATHNCAVYQIDPAEINFDLHGGVQQTPLFESSSEWKLKSSRDKGLKPMLRFIARLINKHVIGQIDDHFFFDFVGLDELTEQEKHELSKEQVQSYMTLNEVRRARDLPDCEGGDKIMSPTYIQALQATQQMEEADRQRELQEAGQATGEGGPDAGNQGQPPPPEEDKEEASNEPSYADSFSKSSKILEFTFDD